MNPFDGELCLLDSFEINTDLRSLNSRQAADASTRIRVPQRRRVLPFCLQGGGPLSFLRLLPHHPHHDCPLHRRPIFHLRIPQVRFLRAALLFLVTNSLSLTTRDRLNPTGHYSPWTHVTAGGIAGAVAAAVTTPLDVCKTLLQTRGSSDDAQIRKARGMSDAARIIWERQGAAGFARGMTPRVLTNMPSNALCCRSLFLLALLQSSRADLERSAGLSYEGFRFLLKGKNSTSTSAALRD